VLRELFRHGGELGAADIARHAGLSPQHVRGTLSQLVGLGLVDELGLGRTRLYRTRMRHPLASQLQALFTAEADRFTAILAAVRDSAAGLSEPPQAVWLYGSVARAQDTPQSDVDIAVVADRDRLGGIVSELRDRLREAAEALGVELAIVGVAPPAASSALPYWESIIRDVVPIFGPDPAALLADRRTARDAA
jgi:predicted nucleotidyltransferase